MLRTTAFPTANKIFTVVSKLTIQFEIPYRLQQKKTSPGRIQFTALGDVMLQGSFEYKHRTCVCVNIDEALLNGIDVLPVFIHLESVPALEAYCFNYADYFLNKKPEVKNELSKMQ